MKDDLKALIWNEVTHKPEVLKGNFPSHYMEVGEKYIILNAHFTGIRLQRKKGANKIQTGMLVSMLRYHCKCSCRLVYSYGFKRIVFLIFDPGDILDSNIENQ